MPKARANREFCLEVIDKADTKATFSDTLRGVNSMYLAKVSELVGQPSKALRIFASDTSTLQQIKKAALKLKVRLLYGREDKYLLVSVCQLTTAQYKLLNAIATHNAASINILQGDPSLKEMNIVDSLRTLSEIDLVVLDGSVWKATPKGKNELVLSKPEPARLAVAR